MKKIIIGSLLILLSGCMSVKKAEKVMRANPTELAKLCADCFPVKESEVIEGKRDTLFSEVTKIDTLKVEVLADCPDGTKVVVDCPPNKVIYRDVIINKTDTIKVRDTAKEQVLQDKITSLENDNKGLTKWKKFGLCGWGIIGISLLVFFLKRK